MDNKYILDENKKPIPEDDIMAWGKWFKNNDNRIVEKTIFSNDIRISTVFLGLDHRWDSGPPVLWETMVFGGKLDGEQERYTSHERAIKGHKRMVDKVREKEAVG